jgi:hypothetical protein
MGGVIPLSAIVARLRAQHADDIVCYPVPPRRGLGGAWAGTTSIPEREQLTSLFQPRGNPTSCPEPN